MDATTPAPAGALQFDTAEPATPHATTGGKTCTGCKTPIRSEYHMANGQVICPGCRIRLEGGGMARESGALRFGRALLYGAGAAVAGTVVYAVMRATIGDWALVAILVGFMVGRAVHVGSRGQGGRGYQALAVGLTYLSIVTSFVPSIVAEMQSSPGAAGVPAAAHYLAAFFLSIPMPFLIITDAPITVLIIAFGLFQAWKQTQRPAMVLSGPYQVNVPAPAPAFGVPAVG